MTDTESVYNYLRSRLNQWQNAIDIHKALKPGCVNWALRSRVSDLRKKLAADNFYVVENRIGDNGQAEYRLVAAVRAPVVIFDTAGQGHWAA